MYFLSTYPYFYGSLLGVICVLIIMYFYPRLRKEILVVGTLVAVYGVLSEYWFFRDYWQPELLWRFGKLGGIEDVLFGFTAGGIAAIIFNLLFNPVKSKINKPKRTWIYPLSILNATLSFILFHELMGMNTIFASALGAYILCLVMVLIRKDILLNSIISGLCTGLGLVIVEGAMLAFLPDYLNKYYTLHGSFPVLFGLFPLTEFIWGIGFGMVVGPLFEFGEGRVYKSRLNWFLRYK